jgi:hypothetical protein
MPKPIPTKESLKIIGAIVGIGLTSFLVVYGLTLMIGYIAFAY